MHLSDRRPVLLCLLAGTVLMFLTAADYLREHPSLLVHTHAQNTAPVTADSGMTQEAQEAVMQLMQRLQTKPDDADALMNLTEHFMHLEDWDKAETFARRASAAAPAESRALYMLGIIQHRQHKHAEAAESLRKALQINNDPSIRYSLGLLEAYYIDKKEEGLRDLQKIVDDPAAPENLKTAASKEMAKIQTNKP